MRFGRHGNLVGTVCRPVDDRLPDRPFVVFLSSGIIHRTGPNRLHVALARELAGAGIPSLRFDLSGIGDSLIPADARASSIQGQVQSDIDDALDLVRRRYDANRFVLVGLCSGADNALRSIQREKSVVGAVLLDVNTQRTPLYYVHHYARRVGSVRAWINLVTGRNPRVRRIVGQIKSVLGAPSAEPPPFGTEPIAFDSWLTRDQMRRCFESVVARDARLLCIFTAGLEAQYNYRNQFFHLFPRLDFHDCLTFDYYADSDHTFSRIGLRQRLAAQVVSWVTESDFPAVGDGAEDRLASGATTSE